METWPPLALPSLFAPCHVSNLQTKHIDAGEGVVCVLLDASALRFITYTLIRIYASSKSRLAVVWQCASNDDFFCDVELMELEVSRN